MSLPDLPPFQPRFPWWTSDLQTIANRLRIPDTLAPHTTERLKFPMPDDTGDTLNMTWYQHGASTNYGYPYHKAYTRAVTCT